MENRQSTGQSVTAGQREIICPNCGHQQSADAATSGRCEHCGELLHRPGAVAPGSLAGNGAMTQRDPTEVAPPTVSGGIGGTTDGTQVPHRVPTAVPGKPMPPTTTDPVGNDWDAAEGLDSSQALHAERGGSG